jgi:tetratricopeptide (TPR) repeat protein
VKLALDGLGLWLALACLLPAAALAADDKAKLFATSESGYARIIIDFPARLDLPPYKVHSDNGVLALEFDQPVDFTLPDISAALPDYVTIARVDPDRKGLRLGLRAAFTVNHLEAGEQLFVDLMPTTWQGLPPGLPADVVANLTERAKKAALLAEQQRRQAAAKIGNPTAEVHIGRNPTFMRVEFIWNVDTDGSFSFDGKAGTLNFDWPVPVDLSQLKLGLPPELLGVDNRVTGSGSSVIFRPAAKVVPRYYAVSNRDFIVDIDTANTVPANPTPQATAATAALAEALMGAGRTAGGAPVEVSPWAQPALAAAAQAPITPVIVVTGSTIRVTFPFERDTAAAVFRRGDTVWMLFDTLAGINPPAVTKELSSFAKGFTVVPAGDEQIVRLDLAENRLATLGSEGKSWVLSLGDMMLAPTEPVTLSRQLNAAGLYEVNADLERPAAIHQFHDPVVGDTLTVVTTYPPARGLTRDLGYVDFDALASVHGLVIKPQRDDLSVKIDAKLAVIAAPGGLVVSAAEANQAGSEASAPSRDGFVDLASLKQDNPIKFNRTVADMTAAAASADGPGRATARLQLARFYVANRFGFEAIGVLKVLKSDTKGDDLKNDMSITLAAADVVGGRPDDALAILNTPAFADAADPAVWRTMAKVDIADFRGARTDAMAATKVIASYPSWVRSRFHLAAVRAALESNDLPMAERELKAIDFADLDPEQTTFYQLLTGRLAEAEGHTDEALDIYGQVIATAVRPSRAEAVYRTILILDKAGKVDVAKATKTLAAEALLWRGNALEANMDSLLANLYFRNGEYRAGLETIKQTVQYFPPSPAMDQLGALAQTEFEDLFLNGKADSLPPVAALGLYYDFRALTPPGSRGDEMIRNLAQRLVKVDLLSQAADLLKYQVENRLKGAAQAEIATELAVIDIANRSPQDALKVLGMTQLADLPPNLERKRRVLQARALIDSSRNDLALDLLTSVSGRDADLLRVDAYWNNKNYAEAGNVLEVMYSPPPADGATLPVAARMDIVKAAVAFALAGDQIGMSRIRAKFAPAMAKAAEWPMFDFVTGKIQAIDSPEFKQVAKSVAGTDSLDAFLASYRQVYSGEAGMTPTSAAKPDGSTAKSG